MTNDQICNIMGAISVLMIIISLPFAIFGFEIAWITLFAGLVLGGITLVNYDDNGF